MGTQGQVDELWVDSAKVTNLADPAATRTSAIQAAKERGCEYNSSIQGTVFFACESMPVDVDVGDCDRKRACVLSC